MENVKSAVEGVSKIKKLSFWDRIKLKISMIDSKINLNKSEKDSNSFIVKNKAIIIVAIAILSTLIIVNVMFKSIAASPVSTISEEEGVSIMSDLYSTEWILDDASTNQITFEMDQIYGKISFTENFTDDGLSLPVKYYQNANDGILGVEMGFVQFDRENQMLYAVLPSTQRLKFLYTKADSGNVENITLINDKNSRVYYIKNKVKN